MVLYGTALQAWPFCRTLHVYRQLRSLYENLKEEKTLPGHTAIEHVGSRLNVDHSIL